MDEVRGLVARGQLMLNAGDTSAIEILRRAAMRSINALQQVWGQDVLGPRPHTGDTNATVRQIVYDAAQAHYLWGVAADRFGHRDEAITAMARAERFADQSPQATALLSPDISTAMNALLRDGLPLLAPDDVLATIASIFYGGLWTPRRFSFTEPAWNIAPPVDTTNNSNQAAPGRTTREFLVTSGKLFPPALVSSDTNKGASLVRIAPLYRAVKPEALPAVLRLDKMILGYERDQNGPNRGLWRQVVRVYYPSSSLTKEQRDDRPRAEALAAQFLKVHALTRAGLGLTNLYDPDGITNIWLSEVSALWPKDEENPELRRAMGLVMPEVNTPVDSSELTPEIAPSTLEQPWRAAGQVEWALGDIMFFRTGYARSDSEWLRELIHEYGHVSLPAFEGFKPPMEPYANGFVGETLGMVWAASDASQFMVPFSTAPIVTNGEVTLQPEFAAELQNHIARHAIPALRMWNRQGPHSLMRNDANSNGSLYLQGLALYADRVYGARLLGAALKPLMDRTVVPADSQTRLASVYTASLLEALESALSDPFIAGQKTLPVWLPAAFESPAHALAPAELAQRAPLHLRAGARVSGWLYVPSTASSLRLEWREASGATKHATLQTEDGWTATALKPSTSTATGAVRLTPAHIGWQQLTLMAPAELTVTGSWFERRAGR
jgi:hypothetical protein